jgi:hypothetical protein
MAAEFVLDVSRHGPLGRFPPLEPALEVLGDDPVNNWVHTVSEVQAPIISGASLELLARSPRSCSIEYSSLFGE